MPAGFFEGIFFLLQTQWRTFATGLWTTIIISIIGTFFGFLIGLVLASFRLLPTGQHYSTFHRTMVAILDQLAKAYIQVFRGTPMIVQATVIYYGVIYLFGYWSAFVAGIVVVSINTAAYMAEIIRGAVNAIDKGQTEAGLSLGMNYFQLMVHIILPQAIKHSIPAFGNELIVNIKDTAVLSVIAVSDLFYSSRFLITTYYRPFEVYFIISVIYLILTLGSSFLLRQLEKGLRLSSKVDFPTSQTVPEVVVTKDE